MLALALGSTGIAHLLYFRLIAELGATGGMTVIFVVPVFGVLWGALFLDEAIHLSTVLGGAVILVSVWLITRTPPPAPVARSEDGRELVASARSTDCAVTPVRGGPAGTCSARRRRPA